MVVSFLQVGETESISCAQSRDRHDVDKRPRATTCTDAALNQQTGATIDLFRHVPFTSMRQQRVDPAIPILRWACLESAIWWRYPWHWLRAAKRHRTQCLSVVSIRSRSPYVAPRPSFSPEAGAHFFAAPGNDRRSKVTASGILAKARESFSSEGKETPRTEKSIRFESAGDLRLA
jgi:hypothetical protein